MIGGRGGRERSIGNPGFEIERALIRSPHGTRLRVKVVPGASRSKIVGMLDDRLKIAVAAPPEAGKANEQVCRTLADVMPLHVRAVRITSGRTRARKDVLLMQVSPDEAAARLTGALGGA